MSTFSRIGGEVMQYNAALPAIQTANAAVDGAAANHAAVAMEADALVARALEADAGDAPKLAKQAEALRVKRLSVLLAEAGIPKLKQAAQDAVRAAAAAEADEQAAYLSDHEKTLADAATAAGYFEGDRQWRQMLATDPTRLMLLRLKSAAHHTAHNYRAMTPDDHAHAAEIRKTIADMLR